MSTQQKYKHEANQLFLEGIQGHVQQERKNELKCLTAFLV
jgi:hypothetical protein